MEHRYPASDILDQLLQRQAFHHTRLPVYECMPARTPTRTPTHTPTPNSKTKPKPNLIPNPNLAMCSLCSCGDKKYPTKLPSTSHDNTFNTPLVYPVPATLPLAVHSANAPSGLSYEIVTKYF